MANLRVDKITSTETFETTGSVQFSLGGSDATRDRLTIASNTDFTTSGDFTIEAWIYPFNRMDNTGGVANSIFGIGDYDTSTGFLFYVKSNGLLSFYTGSDENNTTFKFDSSTWYHLALVRSNQIITIYVDGKYIASYSYDNTFSGLAIIGGNSTNGSDSIGGFSGHISNVRYVNGRALYTENFKPPMRELEVVPGTVLLACQSKSDATLEKTGKTIVPHNTAVASEFTPGLLTPVPKAGAGSAITGSVEFTTTTDALVLSAGEDFAYGTGDFTIEAWIQPQGAVSGETKAIFTQTQSGNDYIVFKVDSDKAIKATFGSTTVSGGTVEVGSWHHVAVTRASNTVKIFVNGVASSGTTVSTDFSDTTRNPTIGQYTHTYGNIEYYGFISNLRVVKGTALYTHDFIPSTRELKKVPGTVLLCCQDPDNPLTEATGKTITGYGNLNQSYGAELVTNGQFTADSDWTKGTQWTIVGGAASITDSPDRGSDSLLTQDASSWIQAGQMYRVGVDWSFSNGDFDVRLGGDSTYTEFSIESSQSSPYFFNIQAGATNDNLAIIANQHAIGDINSISVEKLPPSRTGSNFTPQVGDDRKVTFEGVTKINTENYFYLPTGDTVTRESRSGYGNRGLFSLGAAPTAVNTIEFVNIASTGDSKDFGDLTYTIDGSNASCSSSTRGIFGGGRESPANVNTINYVTIATQGDAIDFGDLTQIRRGITGHSNSIRGVFAGGRADPGPNPTDVIDYITIASTGNALDFGNLITARRYSGSTSSSTRGLVAGGADPNKLNSIEYITIPSKGSAQDFGDLNNSIDQTEGNSNGVRGIFGGGGSHPNYYDNIDYVTIASTGNAKDFGDLLYTRVDSASASNCIRGVFAGGHNPTKGNEIQYVNISSMGYAFDFGNLSTTSAEGSGCSDSHGGLG